MKLIKKIAAIMFAFMMVFSLSANVKAVETESGSITIDNAIKGQTYKIYKIMELESFKEKEGLYSYKPASPQWKTFFTENSVAKKYINVDANTDGITWKDNSTAGENEAEKKTRLDKEASELAKAALAYAIDKKIGDNGHDDATETTVTFNNLDLGYYLVDSSVGALCSLNTTNTSVTIEEKNDVPRLEKKVSDAENGTFADDSFANIGDTVYFKTTITAQPGAEKYILHDTMDKAFTFNEGSIVVKSGDATIDSIYYDIYLNKNHPTATLKAEDDCTFEIRFKQNYLDTLVKNQQIVVTYNATLNENATINVGDHNTAELTYGDKGSVEDKTTTSTTQMKVLKYTGTTTNTLNGAKFKLFTQQTDGEALRFAKIDNQNYRLTREATGIDEIETVDNGTLILQGLKPDVTYWLEETEAPKGYNKLTSRIKVELKQYGMVKVNDIDPGRPLSQVEVENKSGSLLPSTGGAGTTLIYLIGGALVLGSGIVLANKKRAKAK